MKKVKFSDGPQLEEHPEDREKSSRVIRKLMRYVQKKVTILDVARHFRLPTSGYPYNIRCWFHHDKTPSARIKTKDGKQFYFCYAQCGYGDVFWVMKQVSKLKSMGDVIMYMDKVFGLNLHDNVPAILRLEEEIDPFKEIKQQLSEWTDNFSVLNRLMREKMSPVLKGFFDLEVERTVWYPLDTDLKPGVGVVPPEKLAKEIGDWVKSSMELMKDYENKIKEDDGAGKSLDAYLAEGTEQADPLAG